MPQTFDLKGKILLCIAESQTLINKVKVSNVYDNKTKEYYHIKFKPFRDTR